MATVSPVVSVVGSPDGVPRIVWESITTGDTITPYLIRNRYGYVGTAQISGTFGGATVSLQFSNDGSTWFTASDTLGNSISTTANALYEISTAAAYVRATISGGTGDSVNVILVFRG